MNYSLQNKVLTMILSKMHFRNKIATFVCPEVVTALIWLKHRNSFLKKNTHYAAIDWYA